jgi:predicted HAD superfamily Cof-like phosphohydrolase
MSTNFADVFQFHTKFGLPYPVKPQLLEQDVMEFRHKFMEEELDEMTSAYMAGDLAGVADALIDLVYVAMGTAVMMGLPWQLLWDEVQRANMSKMRAESVQDSLAGTGRGHILDVVKPVDFVPPKIAELLARYAQENA